MTADKITTEYKDNQRIDTVRYTYNLSDDYIKLGQLYFKLGKAMEAKESTDSLSLLIREQINMIKGYDNAADTSTE